MRWTASLNTFRSIVLSMSEWGTNQVVAHFRKKLKLESVSQSCDNGEYETIKGNSIYFPPNVQLVVGGVSELSSKIMISAESVDLNYGGLQPDSDPLGIYKYFDETGIPEIEEIGQKITNIKNCYKDGLKTIEQNEKERMKKLSNKAIKFFSCSWSGTKEYKKEENKWFEEMSKGWKAEQNRLKAIISEHSLSQELNAGKVDAGIGFKPLNIRSDYIGSFNTKLNGTLTPESNTESIVNHPLVMGISNNSDTVRIALDGLAIKGKNECKQTSYSICVRKGYKIDKTIIDDADRILFDLS